VYDVEPLASAVVDSAAWVHRRVGPGCFESVYEVLLFERLRQAGLKTERQKSISIDIDGIVIKDAFRVDLLVGDILPLELKATEASTDLNRTQLLTYLRMMKLPLGLLLNFGQETMRGQMRRVVNDHRALPSSSSRLRVKNDPIATSPDL
jgi:GxxExxY protein